MPPPTRAVTQALPRSRLINATVGSLAIMLVLYTTVVHETNKSETSGILSAPARVSNDKTPGLSQSELDSMQKAELNRENCPYHPPRDTLGTMPPVWVAGYPGSGFGFVSQLISAITGVTSADVYGKHGCTAPVKEAAAPTGACLTHWPLVEKDSPASIAASTRTFYYPEAFFVIRNPAHAIPSFHTRWWGAQQKLMGNHVQPDRAKWKKWRDKRLTYHLTVWEQSVTEWVRGVPAAGIKGVGLFVSYEDLQSTDYGPNVTQQMAQFLVDRIQPDLAGTSGLKRNAPIPHHIRYTKCLWRRIYDEEHHSPKVYTAPFTKKQKKQFLDMLDRMILVYNDAQNANHDVIRRILDGYRTDISSNMVLDGDNNE